MSSGLTYLACFISVNLASYSMQNAPFQHFVWTTKVKFTKVKQARWVKPEVMCSLIYVTTHSKPREDWCKWWTKMVANLKVFKTSKKDYILSKSLFFSQKFIGWYVESDKNKNFDDVSTLSNWRPISDRVHFITIRAMFSLRNKGDNESVLVSFYLLLIKY